MQQVIVYRNPLEAAFWNMTASAEMFVIGVGVVCFFVSYLTLNHLIESKLKIKRYNRSNYDYAAFVISALISLFVIYKMWV